MSLDYKLYLHDSDKAAMAALKAIPENKKSAIEQTNILKTVELIF